MMTGWRSELPLERSKFRQLSSDRQKWIILCREEEVQSMGRSRGFDPGRGSSIARGVGYLVTWGQSISAKKTLSR